MIGKVRLVAEGRLYFLNRRNTFTIFLLRIPNVRKADFTGTEVKDTLEEEQGTLSYHYHHHGVSGGYMSKFWGLEGLH